MDLSKKMIGIIIGSLLIILLAVIFWLKPNTESTETTPSSEKALQQQTGQLASTQLVASEALSFASKSQQDTQINCQIRTDVSNRLIVNEQTKDCFEYFITQYGEKTIEQIKTDFLNYTKISYKEPLLSQLNDLWTRYIDYRSKLGDLQAPTADKESAKYYQQILVNTQNLRKNSSQIMKFKAYSVHRTPMTNIP